MTLEPVLPVYLIHWNAPEWCASAARSLLTSTGLDLDVTVVDNGQEGAPALADVLPDGVRVLPTGANRGFSGAGNVALADWGARHPSSPFAVVASHDLQVEPGTLATLVAAARAHPAVGVLSPTILGPTPSGGGAWNGWHAVRSPPDPAATGLAERPWVPGTCMFLRRACVDHPAVAGFDERLGSYLEDVDLCLRARRAGWGVAYLPDARVSTLGTVTADVSYWTDRNTILVAGKHSGSPAMARAMLWVAGAAVRTAAAAVAPWRPADVRTASRRWARLHVRALRETVGSPTTVRAMLREHTAAGRASATPS